MAFGAAYLGSAILGAQLSLKPLPFVGFWLPSGLFASVLLRSDPRSWPGLTLAAVVANLAFDLGQGRNLPTALWFSFGNCAEAWAGSWLTRRYLGRCPTLSSLKDTLGLVAFATLLSPTLSAFIGAWRITHGLGAAAYWRSWAVWWSGDALAVLVLAPFVLTWRDTSDQPRRRLRPGRRLEAGALGLGLVLCAWLVLSLPPQSTFSFHYLVLPFILWAGWRFGPRGAATTSLLLALLAVGLTAWGRGEFGRGAASAQERLLSLQLFLGVTTLGGLIPAALLAERTAREQEIERLNRLYAVLSEVNQAMVRTRTQEELLQQVCRVAVEHGGFRMAWVGWHDPQTQEIRPTTHWGDAGYLAQIRVYADERPEGLGPVGRAFRAGKASVCNDFLNDSRSLPWHRAAASQGLRAAGAFPLRRQGVLAGVLAIYAAECDFFGAKEIHLLEEVAADVSFALDNLEKENLRTQAEEKLRQREEQFRSLIENSTDLIAVLLEDGQVVFASPSFLRILGYQPQEITGRKVLEFIERIDHPKVIKALERAALGPHQPLPEVVRFRHQDGSWRVLEASGRLSPGAFAPGQVNIVVNARDITERIHLESQLRQAQKMEAIGQLAGGVAHDFNNILAAMLMQTSLMGEQPDLTPESRALLQDLEGQAQRASRLTQQLLMFARRQILHMKPLDLNVVLAELIKMLRRLLGEPIELILRTAPTPAWVNADAGMIEQVVMNLCINARDSMPEGGHLLLAIEALDVDPQAPARHLDARPGRFVCLTVRDTGCGMDETTLKRLFEPFFTTKEVGKGTGLGLATAYGIVKQHQGWIEVESTLGQGATFRMLLPALALPASLSQPSGPEPPPRGTETILVVEDEAAVRAMTALCLRRFGYRVLEAASGPQALEVWQAQGPGIDLLFTDVVMPEGMSGLELAQRLRAEKPSLKAILTSGYNTEMATQGVPTLAGIGYLPKPYPTAALAKAIREALDHP